jgi:hypothetical protein
MWSLLDATWMNPPDHDERAGRKAFQLKVAREAGLAIPRTCITTDPERARAFIAAEGGEVIYKTFTATEATWRETRMLRPVRWRESRPCASRRSSSSSTSPPRPICA